MLILVVGVKHLLKKNKNTTMQESNRKRLPTFSIIVPVKDEEKVVGRLLNSLLRLDYPFEKREIIVVEDGSNDKTFKICTAYASEYPHQIKLVHQSTSNGKPSALNAALKHLKGEMVGVFDADNVPEQDILLKTVKYFEDPSVGAVQGRPCSINSDETMLSKFISYEEAVRYETYIRGKDALNLFVPLTGSCYFIRRKVLEEIKGWDANTLSEDVEIAAKLTERNHNIKYAPDVRSWQENPTSLTVLFRQRTRWFRGSMEVSLKYGRLLKRVNRRCIDAEITLFGPFVFIPFLLGYVLGIASFLGLSHYDFFSSVLAQGMMLLTTISLFLIGMALFYMTKPQKLTNLLWLPFVYVYWSINSFVALYALVQIVLKRPRTWAKTAKNGVVANRVLKMGIASEDMSS